MYTNSYQVVWVSDLSYFPNSFNHLGFCGWEGPPHTICSKTVVPVLSSLDLSPFQHQTITFSSFSIGQVSHRDTDNLYHAIVNFENCTFTESSVISLVSGGEYSFVGSKWKPSSEGVLKRFDFKGGKLSFLDCSFESTQFRIFAQVSLLNPLVILGSMFKISKLSSFSSQIQLTSTTIKDSLLHFQIRSNGTIEGQSEFINSPLQIVASGGQMNIKDTTFRDDCFANTSMVVFKGKTLRVLNSHFKHSSFGQDAIISIKAVDTMEFKGCNFTQYSYESIDCSAVIELADDYRHVCIEENQFYCNYLRKSEDEMSSYPFIQMNPFQLGSYVVCRNNQPVGKQTKVSTLSVH